MKSNYYKKFCSNFLTRGLLIFLPALIVIRLEAAPNIGEPVVLEGAILFPDHVNNNVVYYLNKHLAIDHIDGEPDFRFMLNRYMGQSILGDREDFSVRGIIKFSVNPNSDGLRYTDLKSEAQSLYKKNIDLKPAAVKDSYRKLIYKTIEESIGRDGLENRVIAQGEFEIKNNDSQLVQSNFEKEYFSLALQNNDAELFWNGFENDHLLLSLSYGSTLKGLELDKNGAWIEAEYSFDNSLPIKVSKELYPGLFKRIELWQDINAAHSSVTIHCYDFLNGGDDTLYRVDVDIRFKTPANKFYEQTVRFSATEDDYDRKIDFSLANDIQKGYEYRVSRLTMDGEKYQTDWMQAKGAFLDVSLTDNSSDDASVISGDNYELF